MAERLRQFEVVGRGGMAEVYRGVLVGERGTQREVAIKRLRPDLCNDSAAVELFVNEARLAVRLSHANVVHALEFTRDDDGYALVCEWLDCASLDDLRQLFGPLSTAAVLHVGRSVCGALDYLHHLDGSNGIIVHRDVTPANLFVTSRGHVKLGDFGVAWCKDEPSFVEVKSVGTPGFAAPEQATGASVDARADVFGLGRSLAALSDNLPASLASVLQRASAPDPENRFASASDFDDALAGVALELELDVDPKALHVWLDAHGGIPRRPPPPSLDGAVQSIMSGVSGQGLEPTTDEHRMLAPAPESSQRRSRIFFAAVAIIFVTFGLFSLWGLAPSSSIDAPTPDDPVWGLAPSSSIDAPTPDDPVRGLAPFPTIKKASPSDVAPDSEKKTARRIKSALVPVPAPKPKGVVHLNSVPWARVVVDGRSVGNTPIRNLQLSEGDHTVRLIHPPQNLERQVVLKVVGKKTQTFFIDLRRGDVERRVEP